ncbi:hypothetical protein [Rhodococcus koreensis]|uniref:DUF7064 domain-containing protein n=1 Tax=Rhodococcus koreensis TaxID=99653 RepID=UPI003671DE05
MPRSYVDFARPTFREYRWLETSWFSAWTETGMRLHFWTGFRTNLGVATTKVFAVSTVADTLLDMDYCDQQYHIPYGDDTRLSDYSLWSGISVKGRPAPKKWDLAYRSPDGRLTADLEISALMAPVEISWSEVAGAGEGFVGFHKSAGSSLPDSRAGQEPTGHVDQTVRVVGHVVIDGETQAVDCVAQRDHSWSPRAEFRHAPGNFDQVHFGEDLTLLTMVTQRADGSPDPTHAYVLRDNKPRRVREISVRYHREGFKTRRVEYDVTDETGERYELVGEQYASMEIDMGPNIYVVFDQLRFQWEGREGLGETQWHHEVMKLQRERRAARR